PGTWGRGESCAWRRRGDGASVSVPLGSSAGALGAVLAAALLTVLHAHRVERAADDVVANSGKVLHPASADHHHRVLLGVVTHAGDVGGDLDAVGEPDPRHLAKGGVRLLGGGGVDAGAHPTLLGRLLERRALALHRELLAAPAHQLADGRHRRVGSLGFTGRQTHHRRAESPDTTARSITPPR